MPQDAGRARPCIFISSALGPEGSDVRQIRDDIHQWALSEGYDAFLFEKAKTRAKWDALSPAMNESICLANVDQSELFIAIFHNSYGGSHDVHLADVSFTDLEFFEAFRRNIPLKIYIYESVVAQPELNSLINIVRTLVPDSVVRCRSLSALKADIKRDIDQHFRRRHAHLSSRFNQFFRQLILARQQHDDKQKGIRLLLDEYPPTAEPFDPDRVEEELSRVRSLPTYDAQLDATWHVFRRLFAVPWRTNQQWLGLWDRALSTWDKPSAWYGLHGFTLAGKLAVNNTLLAVRALTASKGESDSLAELIRRGADKTGSPEGWVRLFEMGGTLASEYYSIAKRAWPLPLRRKYLLKADDWCLVAARADAKSVNLRRRAGMASIRGEVLMRLGRRDEAMSLLEESLRCRVDGKLGPDSVGWGQVALGYAYFQTGRKTEGQRLVEEGTVTLEQYGSPGFVVRAKKRLASVHVKRGHFVAALREAREARNICLKHGLRDQLDDLRTILRR